MFENCGSCFAAEQFVDIKGQNTFDPNIILNYIQEDFRYAQREFN